MEEKQYMSGCQLRQYLHISTRKMKFLMDHKLIPHINTGHATHKYLVLKEDAEKFLVRLGTDQKLIAKLKGQFPHEGERHPKPFFVASEENCTAFRRWLEKRWAELPDALPTLTAAQISGHAHQRIRELIKENILHAHQHECASNPQNALHYQYQHGFDNYISPDLDPVGYQNQLVEAEARAFAEQFKDKSINSVKNIEIDVANRIGELEGFIRMEDIANAIDICKNIRALIEERNSTLKSSH